jgi:hypothetical protein
MPPRIVMLPLAATLCEHSNWSRAAMFVGHYGVSYAAKFVGPRVPFWVWFIAVQWMDVVWSVLVISGIEKLHIVPGFTEANAYDLYYMPYTHGLPESIAISLVLGVIVAMFTSGDRAMTIFVVAAASFSHWLLDLIVHVPDLPLYDNTAKVGLGLWRHVTLSFPLELIVLGFGAWLYAHDQIHECQRSVSVLGFRSCPRRAAGLREFRPAAFVA